MAINVSELNTGRLTFEGVKIKGALGGSGDGYGADTIELVPDVDLYAAHQYLVIDPTGPDHIHIRAGGTQDNSDATLILGGERTAVKVSDETGNVYIISKNPNQINTYGNSNGTSNSQFIHATGADIIVGDTVQLSPDGDLFTVTSVTDIAGSMTVVAAGLTFTTGEAYNFYRNHTWTFKNDGSLALPSAGKIVNIANSKEWSFGLDGQTVLPENTLKGYIFNATNTVINYIPQSAAFSYGENDIVRLVQAGWYIKGTGLIGWKQITAVQDNFSTLIMRIGEDDIPMEDGSEFPSGGGNVYTISQYLDFDLQVADKTWTFGEDGTTAFPVLTVDLHNGGEVAAEVFQFSGASTQCVITGPTPGIDIDAQRIIIQGQRATGGGYGGDVHLWAGDAQKNGGSIQIYAGDADNTDDGEGSGGYVNIEGGFGYEYGGNVNITGGESEGEGGHVTISGGASDSIPGQVIITSNSNIWTFKNDGNLTIPNLKDIQDVAGNTAISGGNRVKNYNSSSGSVVPIDENNIYLITTTASATTVKLPLGATTPIGYEFIVVDKSGNAASKNITITAESADTIISAASGISIDTNYGLIAFKYVGGNNWIILYGR